MALAHYTVAIESVAQPPTANLPNNGKLRFEISSSKIIPTPDSNNNTKEYSSKNLACFELLEEGIRSIKVAPSVSGTFDVQCTKFDGLNVAKSISVQVIHTRMGTFHNESNENFALVHLQPINNLIPENRPKKLSTFQVKPDNSVCLTPTTLVGDMRITEDDLQNYSRFTFKFTPIEVTKEETVEVEINKNTVQNKDSPSPPDNDTDTGTPEVNGNEITEPDTSMSGVFIITSINEEDETESDAKIGSRNPSNVSEDVATDINAAQAHTIEFTAVFDNLISITVELGNLVLQTLRSTASLPNTRQQYGPTNDMYSSYYYAASFDSKPKFRDLESVARAQAMYREQNSAFQNKSPLVPYRNTNPVWNLRRFIKTIVIHRLQSLGVQQLDCTEILESWESKQSDPFWNLQFPEDDRINFDKNQENCQGIISPFISKPNSALFHLSPSGHITKSIFSTFVTQVESLKGIVNNATCSLIQTSVCLLLPEIKLLWGRQLETNRNPIFIDEWVRLILLAARELTTVSPEEVTIMVNRELKTMKNLSKALHKSSKKIHKKIGKLSKFSEIIFRKTLSQLNPKSLKKLDAFDVAMKKKYSPDVVHYDPTQLHKISIQPVDLFRDHIFLSETSAGELLIKNEIDGFWGKFTDLAFVDRRIIFLALTEDLQTNLRQCVNTIQHLKEIYTKGYPGSIKNLLKDVVEELKFTSRREDLTLLIKTSIVTHVSCLHEMLTRLLFICQEVEGVTHSFKQSLQSVSFDVSKLKRQAKNRSEKSKEEFSDTDTTPFKAIKGYHKEHSAGIGSSNAQLTIPFINSNNIDLTFKS